MTVETMSLESALKALESGEPVLVHDSSGREDETDVFMAAEHVDWEDVRFLRNEAGGMICVAVPHSTGERFELPLMDEFFEDFGGSPDYDDRSSFSITVNHESTFTGVTDRDRATTIRKLAEAVGSDDFGLRSEFRSPGHVHVLLAAEDLTDERQGHTEMAVEMAEKAGIVPAVVVCEMLDDGTGEALPVEKAENYAEENGLLFLEGEELLQR